MKSKTRRNHHLLLLLVMLLCWCMTSPAAAAGPKVAKRTQTQIRKYIKEHPVKMEKATTYKTKPKVKAPFKAGELSAATNKNALNMINQIRYIAGLDANVKLNKNFAKQAQAAALVSALNGSLLHEPEKPSKMDSSLYTLGKNGAGKSNLGRHYITLPQEILYDWMSDSDSTNIGRLAHRRWILNPYFTQTGFGFVDNNTLWPYTAIYVSGSENYGFDSTPKNYNVVWPAQNTPVTFFKPTDAWTVTTGKTETAGKVKVTLVRTRDKKKWVFSTKKHNGDFHVSSESFAQTDCIIFRPKNLKKIKAGDKFNVTITGLAGGTLKYTVKFFKL